MMVSTSHCLRLVRLAWSKGLNLSILQFSFKQMTDRSLDLGTALLGLESWICMRCMRHTFYLVLSSYSFSRVLTYSLSYISVFAAELSSKIV